MLARDSQYGWINLKMEAKCLKFTPKDCHGGYAVMKVAFFGCKTSENAVLINPNIISLGKIFDWINNRENQVILGASVGTFRSIFFQRHILDQETFKPETF